MASASFDYNRGIDVADQEKINIQLDYLTLLGNESQVKKEIE